MSESTNVYRLPVPAYQLAAARLRGPQGQCPMCAVSFGGVECALNPMHKTGEYATRCGTYCAASLVKTTFAAQKTTIHTCSPGQRLRTGPRVLGFLWRRPCDEPGEHLHQTCRACGWRGILLPATET